MKEAKKSPCANGKKNPSAVQMFYRNKSHPSSDFNFNNKHSKRNSSKQCSISKGPKAILHISQRAYKQRKMIKPRAATIISADKDDPNNKDQFSSTSINYATTPMGMIKSLLCAASLI